MKAAPNPASSVVRSVDQLVALDHAEFVDAAHRYFLGRPPRDTESAHMLTQLLAGDAKTWLLGSLRYSGEGRTRAVAVDRRFRVRYLAQRSMRMPLVGPLIERVAAAWRLPASARYFRAMEQRMAAALAAQRGAMLALQGMSAMDAGDRDAPQMRLEQQVAELAAALADVERAAAATRDQVGQAHSMLQAIAQPDLEPTLEIVGPPLVQRARERSGIAADVPTSSLSPSARYALFENAFYDSTLVAAKQRVYLPYLDRELSRRMPFLDLGCGRGEFIRILRDVDIDAVGVDINPVPLATLRNEGHAVVEQDLLAFLEADSGRYLGASLLQVAEHLDAARIERMLELLAPRLVAGAVLIVETPNPLSPFALGQFHTDPTHVAPIPPERLRFAVEAAGFERSRTLFQARVPRGVFAGPDAKAYYMDYAIIAYRCT